MTIIEQHVARVQRRQLCQQVWNGFSWGLFAGGLLSCIAILGHLAGWVTLSLPLSIGCVLVGPLLGAAAALVFRPTQHVAAVTIDRIGNLKDRVTTAWAFLHKEQRTPFQNLQLVDAEAHMTAVDPTEVAPLRTPRPLTAGVILSIAALVFSLITSTPEPVDAALVSNPVLVEQAARLTVELRELEEFNVEENDPEIEELLKQLKAKIEELKQPGLDPKEALAKLSEMQSVLEAKQQQLSDPSLEAELQAVGEALQLSPEMAAAGAAMSNGEMEKAAQELQQLEMPELDRQTERSVTEKLEQVQNSADGNKRSLKEALQKMVAGLSQGNRSKFSDGLKGLAGECKKQGRRKKLSDLLRRQCNCMSECKGECQGQCNSTAESRKKGGTKAGAGASGNESGDKTPMLKTSNQMNITGHESATGDVDVETEETSPNEQQASRAYREKVEKYEQLSESVLDSEPIPLGHRQTIRRYFEMIRPANDASANDVTSNGATDDDTE